MERQELNLGLLDEKRKRCHCTMQSPPPCVAHSYIEDDNDSQSRTLIGKSNPHKNKHCQLIDNVHFASSELRFTLRVLFFLKPLIQFIALNEDTHRCKPKVLHQSLSSLLTLYSSAIHQSIYSYHKVPLSNLSNFSPINYK